MSHDLSQLESQLNQLTAEGKIIEGLDAFYAEDCTFQEGNEEPIRGKAAQRDRLNELFASLKGFNGASLHSSAVSDSTTFSEWTFDMVAGNGDAMVWNETLVRRWQDGKVVSERFYQA